MAEKLDLDALEHDADEERWRGNRTGGEWDKVRTNYHNATRPSTIYALIARIRALESASQPGSGEAELRPPVLPRSLLYTIGEYGMARTDGLGELECQHRWLSLIAGIKAYAADFARQCIIAAPSAGNGEAKGWGES
ncbi:hypothetical protein Cmtc_18970 [Cupriavidus sp. TKC]|uniref:hypothetical protein n=1 Tax=Cupriavidus sp. TKC TaxID=2880159 RepID=UPI0025A8EDCA|nr:hypothetical protein [Cupriavidus sp. TKC]GMG89622.1 hypothetical protein Cmtc_08420 [Cupriavidus sp. TKC]GMG90677.1 hypothetical protein Cmtc_18970 [Cupriavidus sp. TKC]